MARSVHLISISPNAVEGGRLSRGSSVPDLAQSLISFAGETPPDSHMGHLLDTFLEGYVGSRLPATLILPTSAVRFRRMEFSFGDIHKIRQVLPLQMESELLDDLAIYHYDFEMLFSEAERGEVMVFLVERAYLDPLIEIADRKQVYFQRVTFSAHVLAQLMGRKNTRQCLVYVGCDETYIAETYGGNLVEVIRPNGEPDQVLAALAPLNLGNPREMLAALTGEGNHPIDQEALLGNLKRELETVRDEANRFIRIKSSGGPLEVFVVGLFDQYFDVLPDSRELVLDLEVKERSRNGERSLFGVLHQFFAAADSSKATEGINFYKRVGAWRPMLKELKLPLAMTLVLLVLFSGLVTTRFILRGNALKSRLIVIDQDLKKRLRINQPINSFIVQNSLERLEKRLSVLKKEQQAAAYFDQYHYNTLNLLTTLSGLIRPKSQMSVETLSFNRNRFSISGTAKNFNAPEVLKNQISSMEDFKSRPVKMTTSGSAQDIRYRISVEK